MVRRAGLGRGREECSARRVGENLGFINRILVSSQWAEAGQVGVQTRLLAEAAYGFGDRFL